MRGEFTYKILSTLDEGKDLTLDVLGWMLIGGKVASPARIAREREQFLEHRGEQREGKHEERRAMCRFYAMVRYLEQDGMVHKIVEERGIIVTITRQGKQKLRSLENTMETSLPTARYGAKPEVAGSGVTIVTFDIPEEKRRKRDWLRNALRDLGFAMVHKSVWMGKDGVPEDFLRDVRDLALGDYVEIFQITKAGSLRKML
ncbi:MAG: hypothetical protein WC246_01055 [Candidatus Paceibacterota bacterium]|jgi:hypothetical protein